MRCLMMTEVQQAVSVVLVTNLQSHKPSLAPVVTAMQTKVYVHKYYNLSSANRARRLCKTLLCGVAGRRVWVWAERQGRMAETVQSKS